MKDMSVSKALKWIFIASILTLIPIANIVGFVLNLVALYGAGKLEKGYNTAFTLSIVGIVVSVIAAFAGNGVFGTIVSIVSTVVSLGILYFVINTTNALLNGASAGEVAAKGEKVWKINLICTIASVVLSLLTFVPVLAGLLAIVVFVVEVVGVILYLVYLHNSSKALA